jgi:hypothetical protein
MEKERSLDFAYPTGYKRFVYSKIFIDSSVRLLERGGASTYLGIKLLENAESL